MRVVEPIIDVQFHFCYCAVHLNNLSHKCKGRILLLHLASL